MKKCIMALTAIACFLAGFSSEALAGEASVGEAQIFGLDSSTGSAVTQTPEPSEPTPTEPSVNDPSDEEDFPADEDSEENLRRLKKVTGVKLIRFSTHEVKVTWNKHKKAKYYRVYYTKGKKYQLAGKTKSCQMLVKKLKNKKTYRFYVQACRSKKKSDSDSAPSSKISMTMKKYKRKIVFAGDSICEGIGYGQAFPEMHSSAKKMTVAYRGLNTVTFHTKRIFGGKTGLQKLIAENPYRAYMMLGMNEIHYRPADQMIAEYRDMIKSIQQACPETDIVLCAVSPVTRAERARHPGMKQIPIFNKKLKKLAKKMGLTYYDYTDFLKNSEGFLREDYAERDGYHWKIPVYTDFGKIVGKFDKKLDR